MKRLNNLYDKINDIDVIMDMYDKVVSVNTKNKRRVIIFNDYYSCNIINIKNIINDLTYIPDRYNIFLIKEPKFRIIMSQSIKDKVINHLVAKYLLVDVFEKTLINENVATRIGRGTHYGLKLFKKYLNYYKNNYNKFYILKFDISKYFYNIDHKIVKKIISNKIKDKKSLKIINTIIDSTDCSYINESISYLKKMELAKINNSNIFDKNIKIKEIVDIPFYEKGKGFPIGNMTSQIIATIYLNELDHFIKKELNIRCYIRYMDDGILIHHDKAYLKYCLIKIDEVISKYKLKLNRKTKIYSSNEQIEFLGFRFIIRNKIYMKLNNKTKKRFKKKMRYIYKNYNNKLLSYEKLKSIESSYLAHLKHGDCTKLIFNNINISSNDSV